MRVGAGFFVREKSSKIGYENLEFSVFVPPVYSMEVQTLIRNANSSHGNAGLWHYFFAQKSAYILRLSPKVKGRAFLLSQKGVEKRGVPRHPPRRSLVIGQKESTKNVL